MSAMRHCRERQREGRPNVERGGGVRGIMNQDQKNGPLKPHLWSNLAKRALPWVVPIALLIVWQWTSSAGILPSRYLPSPRAVVISFVDLSASGELWRHVRVSTLRALSGF